MLIFPVAHQQVSTMKHLSKVAPSSTHASWAKCRWKEDIYQHHLCKLFRTQMDLNTKFCTIPHRIIWVKHGQTIWPSPCQKNNTSRIFPNLPAEPCVPYPTTSSPLFSLELSTQLKSDLNINITALCFCNANNISKSSIQLIIINQHLYLGDVMYSQGSIPAWSFPWQNRKLTMKASRRQLSSPETALVNFKCSFHERITLHTGRLEVTKADESQRWKAHFMKNNFGFDRFQL